MLKIWKLTKVIPKALLKMMNKLKKIKNKLFFILFINLFEF